MVTSLILTDYGGSNLNLYVSSADIPAITDLDNDGVVGIVTDPGFDAYENRWIGEGANDWGLSSAGDFYNNNGNNLLATYAYWYLFYPS